MLPNNTISPNIDISPYVTGITQSYDSRTQYAYGGIALNDPSQGRRYQIWKIFYDSNTSTIYLGPSGQEPVFSLVVAGVISVGVTFDGNMQPAICYTTSTGASIYFYNSLISGYDTLTITGATSARIVIDDVRNVNSSNSDIIFAYTRDNGLYWRQQRDRYATEYFAAATTKKLIRVDMNTKYRLQFGLT